MVVVLVVVTNSNLKNDSGNNSDRSGRQKNILVSGVKKFISFLILDKLITSYQPQLVFYKVNSNRNISFMFELGCFLVQGYIKSSF